MRVHDHSGCLQRHLHAAILPAGRHRISWDGVRAAEPGRAVAVMFSVHIALGPASGFLPAPAFLPWQEPPSPNPGMNNQIDSHEFHVRYQALSSTIQKVSSVWGRLS